MNFIAFPIVVLAFNAIFLLKVHAADVTPFHVVSSSKSSVTIDLDKNIQAPKIISVFGQHGWRTATLKNVTENCKFLCGQGIEEGKECHHEGVYLINKQKSYGNISGPLLAIEGKNRIKNIKDQINFKSSKSKISPGTFISKNFSKGYRWDKDKKSGKTYLFAKSRGSAGVGSKDWYAPPISLDSCKLKTHKAFEILECGVATLLYHQKELVALSVSEYSSGKLDLKFGIKINGKTYYAVEVSIKGHGQRLKLIAKDKDKWIEFFRAPTYAALC